MTTTGPPTTTWGAPPPTAPKPTKTPLWRRTWVVATATGLAGLIVGSLTAGAAPEPTPQARPAVTAVATTPAATQAEVPATTEPAPVEPTYDTPKRGDFNVTVKVLSKQNFGSAGSNITFRINADWSKTYDPGKTYEVVYEIRGTEDGPMVNTFNVTGDEYERPSEEIASTPSVSSRLTAHVVSVEEV